MGLSSLLGIEVWEAVVVVVIVAAAAPVMFEMRGIKVTVAEVAVEVFCGVLMLLHRSKSRTSTLIIGADSRRLSGFLLFSLV